MFTSRKTKEMGTARAEVYCKLFFPISTRIQRCHASYNSKVSSNKQQNSKKTLKYLKALKKLLYYNGSQLMWELWKMKYLIRLAKKKSNKVAHKQPLEVNSAKKLILSDIHKIFKKESAKQSKR